MSHSTIKSKLQAQRGFKKGFTIVELLIVIVVIGILAAITIVAYNGVTARANGASAKAAATTVIKKAEAYNADGPTSAYPLIPSDLQEADASETYALPETALTFATGTDGTGPNFTTPPSTVPSAPGTVIFYACAGTGLQVEYWDYTASTPDWVAMTTGTCSSPTFKSTGATS